MALFPAVLQPLAGHLLSITPVLGVFAGCFALTTVLERKALGRIQNRFGPNRVGPAGLLQPVADGLKMIFKEDIVPLKADRTVHFLAPVLLATTALLVFSVIPFGQAPDGRHLVPVDLEVGLIFFFAVGSLAELAVFMAGWSSRNKYAMLGAMRAIAQMISYEAPMLLSVLTVVLISGSLSLVDIVGTQAGGFWHWHVLTPWGAAAFLLFLTAALAESNRSPFDIPEAESEIIAGHMIEYSGFKYALFFLAEYLGLFAMTSLAVTLFLGGFHPPIPQLAFVPGPIWFFGKFVVIIAFFIWIRGTLPRLRMDQLLQLAWKFMLPMAVVLLIVAAAWHRISLTWGPVFGWLFCSPPVIMAYLMLGRGGAGKKGGPRVYRYVN